VRLSPFPGLRFATAGTDASDLVCPPYDVVEPDRRAALVARHPHNMVRLTLPQAGDAAGAARSLRDWVARGVLRVDPAPALYVLEERRGDRRWRGVLGAVDLSGGEDGEVLPHEDVLPGPVAGRLELLEATRADLEPILLSVDGGLSGVLDALTSTPPVGTATVNGSLLRLWAVVDPAEQGRVTAALNEQVALIADGHHRWAAAQQHRRHRRSCAGPGPWDRLLAMVVDASSDPLDLTAIHRHVAGETVDRLRGAWAGCRWERGPGTVDALAAAVADRGAGTVGVLQDAAGWLVRRDGEPRARADGHSDTWWSLDAAWLHEQLLPAAGVEEGAVGYHHVPEDAARAAAAADGVAVLLAPVDLSTVRTLAQAGERMPRKATSFSPKPPSGLVMRRHADG
jgi:uncharacterized protein (DUF1015 family)